MKENCNLVKDLMVLYHKNVCSNDSKIFVEKHIDQCQKCKDYLNKMNDNEEKMNNISTKDEIQVRKRYTKISDELLEDTIFKKYTISGFILFWVLYALDNSTWIIDKGRELKDIISILLTLCAVLVTGYTLLSVINLIKNCITKKNNLRSLKLTVFILILFFSSAITLRYFGSFVTTTGYHVISEKYIVDGVPFIKVVNGNNTTQIRCDFSEYEKLIIDKSISYNISFKYSSFSSERGKLIYLLTNDKIDNR